VIQKKALDLSSYKTFHEKDGTILKYLEIEYDNVVKVEKDGKKTTEILKETIACTWSSKRAEKDRKDRERLILKAQKLLDTGAPLESKKGAKRYLKAKTEQKGTKDLALDLEKIQEDAKWDGFYAVQVSKKDMGREEILNAYHSLWKIEESFRVMKHSLEIRPIYLSTPERVIGHIVLCFLAFVLHRNLELELLKEGLEHSVEKIRDAINGLEASILEIGGVKCAVHSPIEGLAKEILRILKVKAPKEAQLCSSLGM
jgi:transposase